VLIRRGADLPLLLILAGVIGGLIAFGVIGLFIGPVVLAVACTLLAQWCPRAVPPMSERRPCDLGGRAGLGHSHGDRHRVRARHHALGVLAVSAGVATLPGGVGWRGVYYASWLRGIGFTMALFVAALTFGDTPLLDTAKAGALVGSATAGIVGYLLLLRRPERP